MRHILLRRTLIRLTVAILGLIAVHLPLVRAIAQAPGYAEILSPKGGEAIQGVYTIKGTASHPAFASYQLSFSYALDELQTWFLLGEAQTNPVTESGLGLWDTTGISDGDYQLRLEVFLTNGSSIVSIVDGVRVRNTKPIEPATATPEQRLPVASPAPPTPTKTPRPTPLPPHNQGSNTLVEQAFVGGVIGGIVLFAGLGMYLLLRRSAKNRWAMLQMRQLHRDQERKQTKKGRR
jgi:hypothetical protein